MSRLSVEIPDALHQQIKAQASLRGLSLREFVLQRLGFAASKEATKPADSPAESESATEAESGSMLELIQNRPWQGTMTKAEIDAYIAEERASWDDG